MGQVKGGDGQAGWAGSISTGHPMHVGASWRKGRGGRPWRGKGKGADAGRRQEAQKLLHSVFTEWAGRDSVGAGWL